ncbi:ankyrin repeat domain-containing protein [Gordonia sp. SL306]|uniref:ankyrin repeat domain-containing protein n=1 Tax=Gordonia sp. SL306 TaxID=2995145 RepID=UPI00226DE262|nr:ankyrin repeat domain-containing protein [Gordonia sp. SL306]WAC57792.1 ankyrin repeat domain-containing protein [Gordonia sp. SL306]
MTPDNPDHPNETGAEVPDDVAELAGRLFDMARAGDAETLRAYLEAGVPADLRNQAGDSLLMLAAYHGSGPAVTALLDHGADADVANDKGQTPLAGAVFKGHDDVVELLVRAGADPHAGTPSAHDAAQMFGRTDYLRYWERPVE